MNAFIRFANALFIIVLMGVVSSAYFEQYYYGEKPCPLCMLQRLAMCGTALGLTLNLKFGIRPLHYGLSLLFINFGRAIALRQSALHICPGSPSFGIPVFGFSLYTWSFIVLFCSSIAIAILLFLESKEEEFKKSLSSFEKGAIAFFLLVTFANVLTTAIQCGVGVCEDVPWPPVP